VARLMILDVPRRAAQEGVIALLGDFLQPMLSSVKTQTPVSSQLRGPGTRFFEA